MGRQESVSLRTQRGNQRQSYKCNNRLRNWSRTNTRSGAVSPSTNIPQQRHALTQQTGAVLQGGVLGLEFVFGAEVFDLGLSDIQLRLG